MNELMEVTLEEYKQMTGPQKAVYRATRNKWLAEQRKEDKSNMKKIRAKIYNHKNRKVICARNKIYRERAVKEKICYVCIKRPVAEGKRRCQQCITQDKARKKVYNQSYSKDYYYRNHDKMLEKAKKYHKLHSQEIIAKSKLRRAIRIATDPTLREREKERTHRYYQLHRKEIIQKSGAKYMEYYTKHREEISAQRKEYYAANKEEILAKKKLKRIGLDNDGSELNRV